MIKKIFTIFCFIVLGLLKGQTIALSWSKPHTVNYGTAQYTIPKFDNEGYETDAKNVYYHAAIKTEDHLQVQGMVWEKVALSDLYSLDPYGLPTKEMANISYGQAEGLRTAFVQVAAFRYDRGTIYRIKSFEITKRPALSASAARESAAPILQAGSQSNLVTGQIYKIKVDKSGVFKITKKFLSDCGINANSVNPQNLRIFGNGGLMLPEYNQDDYYKTLQEAAIEVVGAEDGKWDDADYALFYAQGPHGFNVTRENPYGADRNGRTETRYDAAVHLQNLYEDAAYYFITFDQGPGKRITDQDVPSPTTLLTRYDEYQVLDDDTRNLLHLGRVWVGDAFVSEKKITFNTKSAIRPEDKIYYRAAVVGFNSQGNAVTFNVNGQNSTTFPISTKAEQYTKISAYSGIATGFSGNSITISVQPNLGVNPNGTFHLDYAEVIYKEDLVYNGAQMNFRDYSISEASGQTYGFAVSSAAGAEEVWDVSDVTTPYRKPNKSGNASTYTFGYEANSDQFNNEFVIFKNQAAYLPAFVSKIENQNLLGLKNIDYLIITTKEMEAEAKRLENFHQKTMKSATVTVDKIYNEFSSGRRDITAIRNFVTLLKNENGDLKYLTILGDTSYDFKNKTPGNDNILPSYQSEESGSFTTSFVTDDYFVMTNPQYATYIYRELPALPVGRLPASDLSEAKLLVDKVLAYNNALPGQSTPFGEWRMKLDFVVDDDKDGGRPFHEDMNEILIQNFESGTNSEYNVRKLYLDAFPPESTAGGQRYPQVNQAITSDMSNSLNIFYFGHGGVNGWAQERVLTLDEIKNFNNYNRAYTRFPLVSTITCEFTLWDNPQADSAGERVIKHKTGGAATMITSSRAIDVLYGRMFTDEFTKQIFSTQNGDFLPLGDAHLKAKINFGPDFNHLKVNFLGDPATKLSRPKRNIAVDNIDSPVKNQLRAQDFVTITGHIKKEDGTEDTTFSGRVVVNVYDKRLDKKTRNNDGDLGVMPYTEEAAPIVKAAGKAVNGKFVVEFYMPKDINYTVGTGRMLVYADNFETAKSSAYDVFESMPISIGGINPQGINDSEPPKIQLFMNNTNFANGGITNQNPLLLACITDNTGINSTGASIGHDITVILDGQVVNTVVLNDYFSAGESNGCVSGLADYQKGSVAYPFRNLSPGNHELIFKVWDINNNSATATLNFVVKSDADQKLVLNRLLNWPNPFTDKTYIQFEHNCDDILDVNVQIYTITGKLVRTLSQQVIAEPFLQGYRTPRTAIEWDGKDDFGDAVGKGTYIYKVYARGQNQDKCKGGATAIEKMVNLQ